MSDMVWGRIDACTDCYYVLANGVEDYNTERAALEMSARWPGFQYHLVPGCSTDCCGEEPQTWFSVQSCEACGSHFGGDRQHVTVFYA